MSTGWALCAAAAAALGLLPLAVRAQDVVAHGVRVDGVPLGSGVPVVVGSPDTSFADPVAGGDYHTPNYLPGHPTAATLWPRMVHVPCKRDEAKGELLCAGYNVSPARGEYVYLRPVVELPPPRPPKEAVPAAPTPKVPRPAPLVRKKPLG